MTYTFSRALHMMRYGGVKMRPIGMDTVVFFVLKEELWFTMGGSSYNLHADGAFKVSAKAIMGNWEEVA